MSKTLDIEDESTKTKASNKENNIICFDIILSDFVAIDKNKFKIGKRDNESLSILIDIH